MKSFILTFLGILSFTSACAQFEFMPPVELPFTTEATQAKFGDVDGDGDNDLVFSTSIKSTLFVLYNDDGEFIRFEKVIEPPSGQYIAGDPVNGVIAFDLYEATGDGVLDIVANQVENLHASSISIFSFDAGKFTKIQTINITEPDVTGISLHCSDINEDGVFDVIFVPGPDLKYILTFQSNPGGSYNEIKIATPETSVFRSCLGDLDNDGHDDLVVSGSAHKIFIYKGEPTGGLTFDQSLSLNGFVWDIHLIDATGDGKLDIFTLAGETVSYFQQAPIGTFTQKFISTSYVAMNKMGVADFEDDGDIDIVFETNNKTGYAILTNDGNGSYDEKFAARTEAYYASFEFGDINGDEIPEFLPFSVTRGNIEIFKRITDHYETYSNFHYSPNTYIHGVLRDINKDGRNELVLAHRGANAVSVFNNSGDEKFFSEPTFFNVPRAPLNVETGDYNGDTFPDILYATPQFDVGDPARIGAIMSNSSGQLTVTPLFTNSNQNSNFTSGDFNNDGFDDFVDEGGLYYGKSDGTFTHSASIDLPSWILEFVSADFNNDGFDDIAVSGDDQVAIKWGKSGIGVDNGPTLTGYAPTFMAKANLNNDGIPDLIGSIYYFTLVSLINNGDGTFTPNSKTIRDYGVTFAVDDFDMDGTDDIAIGYNEHVIDIHINDGTGTLITRSIPVSELINPACVISGLVDSDEKPDIIILQPAMGPIVMISDFVEEPTTVSTEVIISDTTFTSAKLSFNKGDGMRRLVVLREGFPPDKDPEDGVLYSPNSIMGTGSEIGAGNYVVFGNDGTSVVVTELSPETIYYYSLYEYNLNERATASNFLISKKMSGSFKTKSLVTGLNEAKNEFSISPNPAVRTLFIATSSLNAQSIIPVIMDLTGRTYQPEFIRRPDGLEVNVESLSSGLYLLKVQNGIAFRFLRK